MKTFFCVPEKENGKGYTVYSCENDVYYAQFMGWWERGGYHVPSARKRITKKRYLAMQEQTNNIKIVL